MILFKLKKIIRLIFSLVASLEKLRLDQNSSTKNNLETLIHLKCLSKLWQKFLTDFDYDGYPKNFCLTAYGMQLSMQNYFIVSIKQINKQTKNLINQSDTNFIETLISNCNNQLTWRLINYLILGSYVLRVKADRNK